MIELPSLWPDQDPRVILEQGDLAAHDRSEQAQTAELAKLASHHPDNARDWNMIQALEALSRRNSAQGLAEARQADRAAAEKALTAKRYWGKLAMQHFADASGYEIPPNGDVSHEFASKLHHFQEAYGQTGIAAVKLRAGRIAILEARIRSRND